MFKVGDILAYNRNYLEQNDEQYSNFTTRRLKIAGTDSIDRHGRQSWILVDLRSEFSIERSTTGNIYRNCTVTDEVYCVINTKEPFKELTDLEYINWLGGNR